MKIGVISDTHMSLPSSELRDLSACVFSDVSVVLHAGDITRYAVLDAFGDKEVFAVCGNMDQDDVTLNLPTHRIVTLKGFRIGLVHGWGSHYNIEERITKLFENVDAIVYGHTHEPANHRKGGVLLFNPGAFSGSRFEYSKRSVGMLTIDSCIHGQIIHL